MKTIIKVTKDDGTFGYVSSTTPRLAITDDISQAMGMDIHTTLKVACILSMGNIPHSFITKG